MAFLKAHVHAALRFLRDHEDALYEGLAGESLFMDDFRNAFFMGAIFPEFRLFAPLRRFVTHDDPALFSCPACAGSVAIADAECPRCKCEWWPGKYKFQTKCKRDSADAQDFWKLHVAAELSEDRVAGEILKARRGADGAPDPSKGPALGPVNFALGDKHPYHARLRLGADFFASVKKRDWAKAGLPALEALTREHLGFFVGVVHHLAVDRARDLFTLEERLAWERAADDASLADLRKVAARWKLWAEAPPESRAGIGQGAYAIIGRWPAEARVYFRPDPKGSPVEQWVGKYPAKEDAELIGTRLPAYALAAADYLAAPADEARLRKLIEPTENCSDKPWFFDRARYLAPLIAAGEAAPPDEEALDAEIVVPAGRAARAILEKGYPEPAADKEGVFHARPREDAAAMREIFEVYEQPAQLAEHFEERGTVRWADSGRGLGRDFDLESVKAADSKGEKDWKDLRTMDHQEFVLYCVALAGRMGEDAAKDAKKDQVYGASEALKPAGKNWQVDDQAAAAGGTPPPNLSPGRNDLVVLRLKSGEMQDVGIAVGGGLMIHNHAADPEPASVRGSHVKKVPPFLFLEGIGTDEKMAHYASLQIGSFRP